MREPINEVQVDKAYKAVFDCLERVEEHFMFCVGLQKKYRLGQGPEAIDLAPKDAKAIMDALKALQPVVEEAERLLIPLDRDLPALHDEPVRTVSVVASSWAEATVMAARVYVRQLEGWKRFKDMDPKDQHAHFGACFSNYPGVPQFRANLKIEAAKLRDRAVAMSSDVRFGYVLRELTPQSGKLMQLLIDREGRNVEYHEVADALWVDDTASHGRIQKAMHRLKRELEGLGSGEIGRDIRSEEGKYRFR